MLRHRTKGLHPGNGVAPGRPGDRENLASELKGKTIVAVTEARYLKNEATILSRRVRRLGASEKSKAIPYSELFTDPEGIEADILILRSSRLETALSGEIIRSLFEFREHHPASAVIVCVVEWHAFLELSKSGAAHVLDQSNIDYPQLLMRGAEAIKRLQDS